MARKLSRPDLEKIAGAFIKLYQQFPEHQRRGITCIDPSILARDVLGLRVLHLPLCQDGSILGLACFGDVEIDLHLDDGSAQTFQLSNKDIVIDVSLRDKKGRYNFTLAHEIAHYLLC